ncbi:DUF7511 domain-containing protein [Haloarchaeobius sp. DT45]|uniref:DUF7511 domain-containing protein n=1 Tax=Haloarchaeobius sp. DT45 TaxID=3446116 RepID=UPI003F6D0338
MPGEFITELDTTRGAEAELGANGVLTSVAEPTEDGVEVTFFPVDVDEDDVLTTWLTVDADSVVDLAAWQ